MKLEEQDQKCLTFIHFNDVYDIEPNSFGMYGFVNFYDAYLKLKEEYPDAITVFSGDAFAPSKLSRVHKGWQMVHCLNMLNIDIACYGNHQFDFLPEHSLELAKSCNFPWLLANVKYIKTDKNLGDGVDYYIMEKKGIKIGFIGLAGPDFKGRLISAYKNLINYENHIDVARKLCKFLREEGCDLIIAITHMRMPPDQQLAKNVPQIDLILGGHDHFVMCKKVNKIPILKSGKNFHNIGVYQVGNFSIKNENKEKSFEGRRWSFRFNCLSTQKSQNKHPQLEKYIQSVINQYNNRGKAKQPPKKKPNKAKEKHQNEWKFTYGLMNGKQTLEIQTTLASQICFAKYICFQKGIYYNGNTQTYALSDFNPFFIKQTLNFIVKKLKNEKNINKTYLYSVGYTCIPYIVQTCEFVYLPNEISFNFNKINDLQQILASARKQGIMCIGIVKYVNNFEQLRKNNVFTAKINFLEIPIIFTKLIQQQNGTHLIILNIHQKYSQKVCNKMKQQGTIWLELPQINGKFQYINIFQKQNHSSLSKNQANFLKKANNIEQEWQKKIGKYCKFLKSNIVDLEIQEQYILNYFHHHFGKLQALQFPTIQELNIQASSIQIKQQEKASQNLQKVLIHIYGNQKYNTQYINALFAFKLAKLHMKLNRKDVAQGILKGIVLNENSISHPTYELGYGYLPILFQINNNKQYQNCRVLQLLDKDQFHLQRWFNLKEQNISSYFSQKIRKNPVYQLLSQKNKSKTDTVIKNSKRKLKTTEWVTKYAKSTYENVKFLNYNSFMEVLEEMKENIQILISTFQF